METRVLSNTQGLRLCERWHSGNNNRRNKIKTNVMLYDKLVSVVIPVYMVEEYLGACLESVLTQTYSNLEVLLCDDGSPDRSGEICEAYARRDNRIRVFHQKNSGVNRARATCIDNAHGDYLVFVDADDTLPRQAIEWLYAALGNDESDMAVGRYDNQLYSFAGKEKIEAKDFKKLACVGDFPVGLCGRIIKKDLLDRSNYKLAPEFVYGEDRIINVRIAMANAKPVHTIERVVYNYRRNPQSASHHFKMTIDYLSRFHEEMKRSVPRDEIEKYKPLLIDYRLTYWHMAVHSDIAQGYADTPFKRELCMDIKKVPYKLGLFDRVSLANASCIMVYRLKIYLLKALHRLLLATGHKGLY